MWTQDQVRNWSVVMPVLRSLMAAKGGRIRSDSNMMGLGRFIRHISYGWGFIDPVRIISAMRGMTEGPDSYSQYHLSWVKPVIRFRPHYPLSETHVLSQKNPLKCQLGIDYGPGNN